MQSNNFNNQIQQYNNNNSTADAAAADGSAAAAAAASNGEESNLTRLAIHSTEFDTLQCNMIKTDCGNRDIALALKKQGAAIGTRRAAATASEDDSLIVPSDSYYIELKKCMDLEHLRVYFPDDYKPPAVKFLTEFKVLFASSERARPRNKTIEFCLEDGIEEAVRLSKVEFSKSGLKIREKYSLYESGSNIKVDDSFLMSLGGSARIVQSKFIGELILKQDNDGGVVGVDRRRAFDTQWHKLEMQKAAHDAKEIIKDANLFHSGYTAQTEAPKICEVKFRYNCCYVACFCYYAAMILHGFSQNETVSYKEAIDCLCSLDRSVSELVKFCPPEVVYDARKMSDLLKAKIQEKVGQTRRGENLAVTLMSSYPDLIDKTTYDRISPIANKLYREQVMVLEKLHESLTHDSKLVIGYKVPPSGGKTALSVSLTAMMQAQFPGKQVLYCCYNWLVRMSVATACYQSETPFWVANTRDKVEDFMKAENITDLSQIDVSAHAKKKGGLGFRSNADRFGSLSECWKKAVDWSQPGLNPIVISDPISALELLKLHPDKFVLYLDEPTAGAESGFNNNNQIQDVISQILVHLPKQSVLLSATLPDLRTDFPSLVQIVGRESVCMVETERLPVGCEAVTKDGYKILPHELAETFEEFQLGMHSIQKDSLMLRFYTPELTYDLSEKVRVAAGAEFPTRLHFLNYFSDIGLISASAIRTFTQELFRWMNDLRIDSKQALFERLKFARDRRLDLQAKKKLVTLSPSNLLDYVGMKGEGNTLAVTSTDTLNGMVDNALRGWPIPDFDEHWGKHQEDLEAWEQVTSASGQASTETKVDSFGGKRIEVLETKLKSKPKKKSSGGSRTGDGDGDGEGNSERMQRTNFGRDERQDRREAILAIGKAKVEDPLLKPVWSWGRTLTPSTGATLGMEELSTNGLSNEFKSRVLSGIGVYKPAYMSYHEQCILIREAAKGKIGCLFSDPNIVYGTNMPLITVYIGQAFGRNATRDCLYQLIGRAGRTGLANKARIVFEDNETLKRALLPASNGASFEAQTMERFLFRFTAQLAAQ